jgi:hypothetical protein
MLMRWPVCLPRHDDRQLRMVIRIWGTPIADLCGPLTRVTNARLRPDRAVLRGWAAPAGEPVDMSSVLFAARRLAGVSTRKVRAGRAMEPARVSQSHPPAPVVPARLGTLRRPLRLRREHRPAHPGAFPRLARALSRARSVMGTGEKVDLPRCTRIYRVEAAIKPQAATR